MMEDLLRLVWGWSAILCCILITSYLLGWRTRPISWYGSFVWAIIAVIPVANTMLLLFVCHTAYQEHLKSKGTKP